MATHVAAEAKRGEYEKALARIPELEVLLATAESGLDHAQADNSALKDIHTDLVTAYKRLREQNQRAVVSLEHEREERQRIQDEHAKHAAVFRAQLEAKARDLKEMQANIAEPFDLDCIRLQLAEEIGETFQQQLQVLEGRLKSEQRKATDAHRHLEMLKAQAAQREEEMGDERVEQAKRFKQKEHVFERHVAALEAEMRKHLENAPVAAQAREQLQERLAQVSRLQQELAEQEQQSQRDRAARAEQVSSAIEEAAVHRRRGHEFEVQQVQGERQCECLQSDINAMRRENEGLLSKLEQADAKARAAEAAVSTRVDDTVRGEISQIRALLGTEREKQSQALRAIESQQQAAVSLARQADTRAKELENDLAEQQLESTREQEELERRLQGELEAIREQVQAAHQDLHTKRQAWREKEIRLTRELETATASVESLNDDLAHCQTERDDAKRQLRDARNKDQAGAVAEKLRERQNEDAVEKRIHQLEQSAQKREHELELGAKQRESELEQLAHQRERAIQSELKQREHADAKELRTLESELRPLQDRAERFERELPELSATVETYRTAALKHEKRGEALLAELKAARKRLDEERSRMAREIDETSAASLKAAEEQRAQAVQSLQDEHQRQLAKHQAAVKKALQKDARKRQDLKTTCQELARKITQLHHEKDTAARITEENRNAFDVRIAELRFGSCYASLGVTPHSGICGASANSVCFMDANGTPRRADSESPTVASRKEFRGISERLERHAEWLRASRQSAGTEKISAVESPSVVSGDAAEAAHSANDPRGC